MGQCQYPTKMYIQVLAAYMFPNHHCWGTSLFLTSVGPYTAGNATTDVYQVATDFYGILLPARRLSRVLVQRINSFTGPTDNIIVSAMSELQICLATV